MTRVRPPMAPPTKFGPTGPAQAKVASGSGGCGVPPPLTQFAPSRSTGAVQVAQRQIGHLTAAGRPLVPAGRASGWAGAGGSVGIRTVQRMIAMPAKSRVWHCVTCANGGVDESFDYGYAAVAPTWNCNNLHTNWAAGPSPLALALVAPPLVPVVVDIEYPFPKTGVPPYLYRWCSNSEAKKALKSGIRKYGGIHDGIPTLGKPIKKGFAQMGGGIGIVSAEVCLKIDTQKIPEIEKKQENSVNFVKGKGNSEYKVMVDIPADAISKV